MKAALPMKKSAKLSQLFFAAAPPLLAALLLAALPCQAEKPHPDGTPRLPKQQENRFLLVVDTSSAMSGCSNAIVQDVVDLLESDLKGEFRLGDTIGLWTFNDKLHPEFPMQIWSKTDKDAIVADIATFLLVQTYGKRAHFDKVMHELNQVIKNSERITVVLFSGGGGLIQGTPFDREINDLQKKYAREFRGTHVPFVTVLAARNGAVFEYAINYPGVVAVPHTANPAPLVQTNAPVAAATPNPAANVPATPPPMRSLIMLAATNVVHAAAPPQATVTPPAPPAATVMVPAPPQPQPVSPPPVVAVASVPAPASHPTHSEAAPSPREAAPPQPRPAPPPIVAPQNPEPVKAIPAPQAPSVVAPANDQQPAPAAPVLRNPPVANAGPLGGTQLALFVMAFSLLTIAVVLVVFLVRRSRSAPQSSLITQSMDRPR
jgi:hypothetical protein